MKKITRRTVICLILSLLLIIGTFVFIYRFFTMGSSWASFPSNTHIYTNGQISSGAVFDNDGTLLAQYTDHWNYSDNASIRQGTVHAVGDPGAQIGTGALSAFAGKLTGYNIVTGTGVGETSGRNLYLTIDADLCATAYDALGSYNGVVGVYDYTTGKILCMVSKPCIDPYGDNSNVSDGAYINKFISSTFVPGSTFKVLTMSAALENISGVWDRSYKCDQTVNIGGYRVSCTKAHHTMNITEALNQSCNVTFGQLAVEMGSGIMEQYVDKAGLTSRYSINGIQTAPSTFDFEADGKEGLAWSGVGQGKDLVNPCSMMVFMGAIGNRGQAANPQLINSVIKHNGLQAGAYIPTHTAELINPDTAESLAGMMRADVIENYGQSNFPGLNICAKSGTAELSSDENSSDNGLFVGFLDDPNHHLDPSDSEYHSDPEHPLAFIAMVEGGGYGAKSAGKVINTVLQKAIELGY